MWHCVATADFEAALAPGDCFCASGRRPCLHCALSICNDQAHALGLHGDLLMHMQDMLLKCQLPGAPDDCLDILDDTDVKLILEEASQGNLRKLLLGMDCGLSLMLTQGQAVHLPPA